MSFATYLGSDDRRNQERFWSVIELEHGAPVNRVLHRSFFLEFSILLLHAASVCLPTEAASNDEIPIDLEVTLIGKILTYDQNLAARLDTSNVLHPAVLYLPNNAVSERRADDLISAVHTLSPRGLIPNVRIEPFKIPFVDPESVEARLALHSVTVIYICPALDNHIDSIISSAENRKRLTVGAKESYVVKGVSFGVLVERNKPKMVVNLPSSIHEGAKFSSTLLRLATVLR